MTPEIVATYVTGGFAPIAFYLMYKMANTTIKDNTQALQELRTHLNNNCKGRRR